MVPDAGNLYQVDPGAPRLDGGVLLHYLDGFIDAGAAGRLLTAVTALMNRSHSWSGSGPVRIRNGVPPASRTWWISRLGAS